MSSEDSKEKEVQAALRQVEGTTRSAIELETIFRDHNERVLNAAFRVTGSVSDAEDVLQNVFLRLLSRRDLPNRSDQLAGYLQRAAVNASIDLLRKRKPTRLLPLEEQAAETLGAKVNGPEQLAVRQELEEWLRSMVSEFSPQAAEIFALRFFEGYTNQEIAEMIGTSPGVVAVVLHRSRTRLRNELRSLLGGTE